MVGIFFTALGFCVFGFYFSFKTRWSSHLSVNYEKNCDIIFVVPEEDVGTSSASLTGTNNR